MGRGIMTATDELRRMLDERGVEHRDVSHITLWGRHTYDSIDYYDYVVNEIEGQLCLSMHDVTPEQAVEATLGRGECRRVMDSIDLFNTWVCDHCGHPLDASDNFCCGCGWKVKQ